MIAWKEWSLHRGDRYRFVTYYPDMPDLGVRATIGRLVALEEHGPGVDVFILEVDSGLIPILGEAVLDIQTVARDAEFVVLHPWRGLIKGQQQVSSGNDDTKEHSE